LWNDVLASYQLQHSRLFKDCVLNIYVYHHALVGVVEHPKYRRICDMNSFGFTAQDYIAWRHEQTFPASVLNRKGSPERSPMLRAYMLQTAEKTGWPIFTQPASKADFFDFD
jgi:hypothetical protein